MSARRMRERVPPEVVPGEKTRRVREAIQMSRESSSTEGSSASAKTRATRTGDHSSPLARASRSADQRSRRLERSAHHAASCEATEGRVAARESARKSHCAASRRACAHCPYACSNRRPRSFGAVSAASPRMNQTGGSTGRVPRDAREWSYARKMAATMSNRNCSISSMSGSGTMTAALTFPDARRRRRWPVESENGRA